jgi:hypothetical protein
MSAQGAITRGRHPSYDRPGDAATGLPGNFMLFFRALCGGRETLPFFTLNYDTAIEEATSNLGIRRVDGIIETPGAPEGRWTPATYTGYQPSGLEQSVVLVKLHGSVNQLVGQLGREAHGRPEDRHTPDLLAKPRVFPKT